MTTWPLPFDAHPDCTLCALHECARHPGIPTRPYALYDPQGDPPIQPPKSTCVFIVGQNPGFQEDEADCCWIGYSGQMLMKFIRASGITLYTDVYLGNACRCRSEDDSAPTAGQRKACLLWLQEDYTLLRSAYQRVVLFTQGAPAAQSLGHKNLKAAFSRQGLPCPVLEGSPPLFATFHPAVLSPGRQPHRIDAVQLHWNLLRRYLESGSLSTDEAPVSYTRGLPPPESP